jgi:hypothetical protein
MKSARAFGRLIAFGPLAFIVFLGPWLGAYSSSPTLSVLLSTLGALGILSTKRRLAASTQSPARSAVAVLENMTYMMLVGLAPLLGGLVFHESSFNQVKAPLSLVTCTLIVVVVGLALANLPKTWTQALIPILGITAASVVSALCIYLIVRGEFLSSSLATFLHPRGQLDGASVLRGAGIVMVGFLYLVRLPVAAGSVTVDAARRIRPALATAGLVMVLVTYTQTLGSDGTSFAPAQLINAAARYGGAGLQKVTEAALLVLLVCFAAQGAEIGAGMRRQMGASHKAAVVVSLLPVAAIILARGSDPLNTVLAFLEAGISLACVAWLAYSVLALHEISKTGEPWYEFLPPSFGAILAILGLWVANSPTYRLDTGSLELRLVAEATAIVFVALRIKKQIPVPLVTQRANDEEGGSTQQGSEH